MELPNKYCHNCGKLTPPVAKFCPACGTSLASIDERPPAAPPVQPVPNRIRPKAQATFTPMAVGEDDDDDESIRADRAGSLSDLGISISSLDVALQVDRPSRETVGSLVQQGQGMQGYQEPPRVVAGIDQQAIMQQLQQEAGTLRK